MFCRNCGNMIEEGSTFCGSCGSKAEEITQINHQSQNSIDNIPSYPQESGKENATKGFLGALLGSLIGAVAIIIFGQLGFVAAIAGVVMAIGTISMYEKFAKGISKKGILICIVVMLIMTLLAENMSISIQLAKIIRDAGIQVTTFQVFNKFFELLKAGYIETAEYIGDLIQVYLFTILGAVGTISAKLKEIKEAKH